MDGILLIDKPKGLTSSQCVYNLRKILGFQKIGHCGTLDPLATGVLPICLGSATRFSSFVVHQNKKYRLSALLGVITDSGDLDGKIIRKESVDSHLDLSAVFEGFLGEQLQFPPMYSAVKKNGHPLYKWVRKGIYLKREARQIEIQSIKVISVDKDTFELEVVCSKGTYIRSLVEAIGEKIGTGATLTALRRLAVGEHTISETKPFASISRKNILDYLLPADELISDLPSLVISKEDAKKIRNGRPVDYNAPQELNGVVKIYDQDKVFLGIGYIDEWNTLKPKRLFPN